MSPSTVGQPPSARAYHGFTESGGLLYVFGGYSSYSGSINSATFKKIQVRIELLRDHNAASKLESRAVLSAQNNHHLQVSNNVV